MQRRPFLLSPAASALPATSVNSIVARFAQVAQPILVKRFGEASCVSSTRTAIEALRHFKIPARPLVCRMKVRDYETGHRHVVGPGVLTGRAGLSGFAYHLVAIVADRLLIDAIAGQAVTYEPIRHSGLSLPLPLAGASIHQEGLGPWLEIAGLSREKLPEVLAQARRVTRGW